MLTGLQIAFIRYSHAQKTFKTPICAGNAGIFVALPCLGGRGALLQLVRLRGCNHAGLAAPPRDLQPIWSDFLVCPLVCEHILHCRPFEKRFSAGLVGQGCPGATS